MYIKIAFETTTKRAFWRFGALRDYDEHGFFLFKCLKKRLKKKGQKKKTFVFVFFIFLYLYHTIVIGVFTNVCRCRCCA